MTLQKSVNTITLLSSAVAGIIGSGWLLSPFACAKVAGPAAILAWIIGGIAMMIIASTFAILTRTLPTTGGTVRFFQFTHGHFAGFGFSWIAWLAWVVVAPIEMMAIIQYSTNYLPSLMTHSASPVLTTRGLCIAILGMIIIAIINTAGMTVYTRVSRVIFILKLIVPISASLLLLHTQFHVHNFTMQNGFMPFGLKSIFSALPLAGVIYSFIGFNPVVELSAESKNPRNAVPVAIFGALLICMIIYILVQTVFIGALPTLSFMHGWKTLSFVGDKGPFAGLLALFGFAWFVKILYFDACASPFGTAFVQSVSTSRITYGMAQNGYFPAFFMHVTKNGTPMRAFMLNTCVGLLFFLPFPSWQHMVGFLVSCLVLGYVVGPMSLMILAKQQPELFKPLSQKMIHTICITAFYLCNLIIFWSGWSTVYKILILFGVGYSALFFSACRRDSQLREALQVSQGSWVVLYLAGLGVMSYFGSFGGVHDIAFGVDFAVMGVFSVAIYAIAFFAASAAGAKSYQHISITS